MYMHVWEATLVYMHVWEATTLYVGRLPHTVRREATALSVHGRLPHSVYMGGYRTLLVMGGYRTLLVMGGIYTRVGMVGGAYTPGWVWWVYHRIYTLGIPPPWVHFLVHHPTMPGYGCYECSDGCTEREPWAQGGDSPWVGRPPGPQDLKSVNSGMPPARRTFSSRGNKRIKIG